MVILREAPEGSAFFRSYYGEEAAWSPDRQLLAAAVDVLNIANWQRGGGKRKDFPQPIPRPGVGPERSTYGDKASAIPIDEMAAWLGWTN